MNSIIPKEHVRLAAAIKEMMSEYNDNEEIINLGAYVKGANPVLDRALLIKNDLNAFLKQEVEDFQTFENTLNQLKEVYSLLSRDMRKPRRAGK
jgi:flagellum-specific ATP synthase